MVNIMNMVLHCTICDDNPSAAQQAKEIAERAFYEKNISADISVYTDSGQLMFELDDNKQIDILILDIEMPKVSGFEIAEYVKKSNPNCLIIFMTSYVNYAVDGYELDIFRFVPKQDGDYRLKTALLDATGVIDLESKKSYFIERHDMCGMLPCKYILYITKRGKNSEIYHLKSKEPIKIRKPLAVVFEELDSNEFIYISRGCIANMANVQKVDRREWVCKNGDRVPISASLYAEIKEKLLDFWGRKIICD